MAKANVYRNPADNFLWLGECTVLDFSNVPCLERNLHNLKLEEAVMEYVYFYGMCMASADLLVVKGKDGMYAVMTPYLDTMGNGAIYRSLMPGYYFKDVYCYASFFGGREIVIAQDKDDCWGAIEIIRNYLTWDECNSIYIPNIICHFDHESLENVLGSLNIKDVDGKFGGPSLSRLIDQPIGNRINDVEYGNIFECKRHKSQTRAIASTQLLVKTNPHKTLAEKEQECKDLLRSTRRSNIEALIDHIEKMGYFIAPGSTSHHRFKGGLVSHSLEVFRKAMELRKEMIECGSPEDSMPQESVIISALLHDVCKADLLRFNNETKSVEEVRHGKGHSARSVRQIEYSGFVLTPDEKDAILWHMGGKRMEPDDEKRRLFFSTHPLAKIIIEADHRSISEAKKRHHRK